VTSYGGIEYESYVFSLVAGTVFLLVALAHLLRIVFRVPIVVEDIPIPFWASGVAAVCAGFLSYEFASLGNHCRDLEADGDSERRCQTTYRPAFSSPPSNTVLVHPGK